MGRPMKRQGRCNRETQYTNNNISKDNRHQDGRRWPSSARGGIHKHCRYNRARRGHTSWRQSDRGRRKTGTNNRWQSYRADKPFGAERTDIRDVIVEAKTKDPCEISLILGVENLCTLKNLMKQATSNGSRHRRFLNTLEKTFQSEATPASMLNVINAMMETEFVFQTVIMLKNYFKDKQSDKEDISYLDAVCALLRIMIRVCALHPSAITFIQGSYTIILDLKEAIVNCYQHDEDSLSTNQHAERIIKTDTAEPESEMETDRELLPTCDGSILKTTNAKVISSDHTSENGHSKDNSDIQKQILSEEKTSHAEINTRFATFIHLFGNLGANVQSCILRRKRRQNQEVYTDSEESQAEDFRDIPIFPRLGDLNGAIKPYLRVHKAKGAYRGVDDYLDVQFRLLREDFVEPLREGIRALTGQMFGKDKKKIQEIKVYENTQIISAFCGDGVNHVLSFDISKLRGVRWNMSKRLKYGSLICITADNFQTCYFATIVDSDIRFRRQGRLHVKFAHDPDQVKLLTGTIFTMIESTAYFEAYRPVLSSLQTITECNLPFKQYIISCEKDITPPKYLLDSNRTFDLRCLLDSNFKIHSERLRFIYPEREFFAPNEVFSEESNCLKYVNVLESKWPMEDKLHLDLSQLDALKTALTKEFSVIQGPPGCGKTHVGLKIAKVLLHNKKEWKHENGTRAQLLVVCYTNHALDQFMEGICSFYDGDIVRVGGRSTNETMVKYSFKAIKNEFRKSKGLPSFLRKARFRALSNINNLQQELNLESEKIKILKENIVHETSLYSEMGLDHFNQLMWSQRRFKQLSSPWSEHPRHSGMVKWLGITEFATEIHYKIHNTYQRTKDLEHESTVDESMNVENREPLTEIDFDFKKQLGDIQKEDLKAFKRDNIALDVDDFDHLKGVFLSVAKKIGERERRKLAKTIQDKMLTITPMSQSEAKSVGDILSTRFSEEKRWALYLHWVQKKCNAMYQGKEKKLEQYQQADDRLKEVALIEDRHILQNADIIGMTITGAAKNKSVLRCIKPTIMIVEEAAEVFESHLISNLTSGCEQLIMIGDHKQLKPKPNVYRLEREYNLDLSLFERMVRNGIRCQCLKIQHRMRPEIADNVRHFYETLTDHDSVKEYDSINGITHNMYFIDHCVNEKKDEELKSYTNLHEVHYLIALCKYLLHQGYDTSKITILTTYSGQMFMMKKEMLKQGDLLKGVKMTIVDNYQGEENDIILLSLVRSNEERRIGFLARDNRVCVALSRAKKGLYIIGNGTCLSSAAEFWESILNNMRRKGLVGKALQLCCQNHPEDKGIVAECLEDFQGAPEGGCQKLCDTRLDCGHVCERYCHIINREHKDIICRKPCARKCRNGHRCKKMCWQDCHCDETVIITMPDCGHIVHVGCSVDLERYICEQVCNKMLGCGHVCRRACQDPCVCMEPVLVNLPCGHDATIPCSIKPEKHKCNEDVKVLHTDCGHFENIKCHDLAKRKYCRNTCNLPLDCGHLCSKTCGDDASSLNHLTDNDRALSKCPRGHISECNIPCETNLKCGHTCKGSCYTCFKGRWHKLCTEECNCNLICGHSCKGKCGFCFPCTEDCFRRCSHNVCKKKCIEACIPCRRTCNWKCKHFACNKLCGDICDRPRCDKPCKRLIRPCGHECIGMCGDPCPTLCRICDNETVNEIHFGAENLSETRFVQLQDCGHLIKYDIMDDYMDIDEGACLKRCPLCKEPIRNTNGNRYENIVNRIYMKIDSLKRFIFFDFELRKTLMASAFMQREEIASWVGTFGRADCPNASTYYDLTNILMKLKAPPQMLFNFLACRDVVNTLNQLAIFSFVKLVSKQKSYTVDKKGLLPDASLCLSSSQHLYEVERELKRFLDRCQLEKIQEAFQRHDSCDKEIVETIENANKVLLQAKQYLEEDRAKVQEYIYSLPEKENLDKRLIKLSFSVINIDRDAIISKQYIDVTYQVQELIEHNSTCQSEPCESQQSPKKQCKKRRQVDICSPSSESTNKCLLYADSVQHQPIGEHKMTACITEHIGSKETLLKATNQQSKICNLETGTEIIPNSYKYGTAGQEIENKVETISLSENEEVEEGEICENEISEPSLTNTGVCTKQASKQNEQCTSREVETTFEVIEDGEIIDEYDMSGRCIELAKDKLTFQKNVGDTNVYEADIVHNKSSREDAIKCTDNSFSEDTLQQIKGILNKNEKDDDTRKGLPFKEESERSVELQSTYETPSTSFFNEHTHVINLFTWPGAPYFHSEQSVLQLKPVLESDSQNSDKQGTSAKRPVSKKDGIEVEPAEKKVKRGTEGRKEILALNHNKRLNVGHEETEPKKKKFRRVSFNIQTKSQKRIALNEQFDRDIEEDGKQDLNPVPYKTDTRKVINTGRKSNSTTNAVQEPNKETTQITPFVMQKGHWPTSHVAAPAFTRQLVDYADIDINAESENVYNQEFTSELRTTKKATQREESKETRQMEKNKKRPLTYNTKVSESTSTHAHIENISYYSERPTGDHRGVSKYTGMLDLRNQIREKSNKTRMQTKTDNEGMRQRKDSDFIKSEEITSEANNDLRHLINNRRKCHKENSPEQDSDTVIEMDDDVWTVLDTA